MQNLRRDILLRRAKFSIDRNSAAYLLILKLIHDNINSIRSEGRNFLKPPPQMTGSEYADKYGMLPETSFKKGRFRVADVPHTKFWLDALWHPKVRIFVIMGSAQGAKTITGTMAMCQRIEYKPGYMMVMHPNEENARDYAKDIFDSVINQIKRIKKKFARKSAKDESSVTKRSYEGGKINFGTALSKSFLRQKSAGFLWGDDVDGVRVDINSKTKEKKTQEEGDHVERLISRGKTFPDSTVYLTSTPTRKGASRIEYYYELGNMCKLYVSCPECNHEFYFVPEGLDWQKDFDAFDRVEKNYPETAYYKCPNINCGHHINEVERKKMLDAAIDNYKPEPGHDLFEEITSVWYWDMNSKLTTMKAIVSEIIKNSGDEEKLEVLYNNVFGLPYQKKHGERPDPLKLMERRYNFINRNDMLMPNKVLMLTASVDVQQGSAKKNARLEVKVMGFGKGDERFIIFYGEFPGNSSEGEVWSALDEFWERCWFRKDGIEIKISAIGIDSGYNKEAVYKYLRKKRFDKRFVALKGKGTYGAELFSKKVTLVDKNRVRLIHIGHNAALDDIYNSFLIDRPKDETGIYIETDEPIPNYTHFCDAFCDAEYFTQLASQEAVRKKIGMLTVTIYEEIDAHTSDEVLDLYKYCYALTKMLSPNYNAIEEKINVIKEKMNIEKENKFEAKQNIQEHKNIPRPKRRTNARRA